MKMTLDGTPAEIVDVLKGIKSEPATEKIPLLADSTRPWSSNGTPCCDYTTSSLNTTERQSDIVQPHRAN